MKTSTALMLCALVLTIIYIPVAIAAWSERASPTTSEARYKPLDWTLGLLVSNAELFNERGKKMRLWGAGIEALLFVLWMIIIFK